MSRDLSRVRVGRSAIHGLGAFAARAFGAGEVVLALDDSRVVDDAHPVRSARGEHAHHQDYLAGGRVVLQRWEAYARENVAVYVELAPHLGGSVLALSSGFIVYPPVVHPTYAALRDAIARGVATVVLLPSLDREACVVQTVRRQLVRPFGQRNPAREEAVIRERFERYRGLPAMKVETMRPAHEVAAVIHARLAEDAPEALSAGCAVGPSLIARSNVACR